MLPAVRRSIRKIKQYYVWREQVRSDLVRVLGAARSWHLVLADRFVERGWIAKRDEYFCCNFEEIAEIVRGRHTPTGSRMVGERFAERERTAPSGCRC